MIWWAYSAHWQDWGVTITVSVQAPTQDAACDKGRRKIAALFPGWVEQRSTEMAEDMTAKLAAARRQS